MGQAQTIHYHSRVSGRAGGAASSFGTREDNWRALQVLIDKENREELLARLNILTSNAEQLKESQSPYLDFNQVVDDILRQWAMVIARAIVIEAADADVLSKLPVNDRQALLQKSDLLIQASKDNLAPSVAHLIIQYYGRRYVIDPAQKSPPLFVETYGLPHLKTIMAYENWAPKTGVFAYTVENFENSFQQILANNLGGFDALVDAMKRLQSLSIGFPIPDTGDLNGEFLKLKEIMEAVDQNASVKEGIPNNVRQVVYKRAQDTTNYLLGRLAARSGIDLSKDYPAFKVLGDYGKASPKWGIGNLEHNLVFFRDQRTHVIGLQAKLNKIKEDTERLLHNPGLLNIGTINAVIEKFSAIVPLIVVLIGSTIDNSHASRKSQEISQDIARLLDRYYGLSYIRGQKFPTRDEFYAAFPTLARLPISGNGLLPNWNTHTRLRIHFREDKALEPLKTAYGELTTVLSAAFIFRSGVTARTGALLKIMKKLDDTDADIDSGPPSYFTTVRNSAEDVLKSIVLQELKNPALDSSQDVARRKAMKELVDYAKTHRQWEPVTNILTLAQPSTSASSAPLKAPVAQNSELLAKLESLQLAAKKLIDNPPEFFLVSKINNIVRQYGEALEDIRKSVATDVTILGTSLNVSKSIASLIRLLYERQYIETGAVPTVSEFIQTFPSLPSLRQEGPGVETGWNNVTPVLAYINSNLIRGLRSAYTGLANVRKKDVSISALFDEILAFMKEADRIGNGLRIPAYLMRPIWEQAQKAFIVGRERSRLSSPADNTYRSAFNDLLSYNVAHQEWGLSEALGKWQEENIPPPSLASLKSEPAVPYFPSAAAAAAAATTVLSTEASPSLSSSKTCRRHSKRQCPAKDTPADAQYQRGLRCGVYYWKQTDETSIPKGKTNTMKFDAATGKVFVKQYCRPQSKEVLPIPDQGAVAAEAKRSLLVQRAIELGVKRADRLKVSQLRKAIKIATSQ